MYYRRYQGCRMYWLFVPVLFPYLYLMLSSFKPPREVISSTPAFFPSQFTMDNYLAMFNHLSIGKYFGNSLVIAAFATLLSVLLPPISRKK